jgi:hypothetical protein
MSMMTARRRRTFTPEFGFGQCRKIGFQDRAQHCSGAGLALRCPIRDRQGPTGARRVRLTKARLCKLLRQYLGSQLLGQHIGLKRSEPLLTRVQLVVATSEIPPVAFGRVTEIGDAFEQVGCAPLVFRPDQACDKHNLLLAAPLEDDSDTEPTVFGETPRLPVTNGQTH